MVAGSLAPSRGAASPAFALPLPADLWRRPLAVRASYTQESAMTLSAPREQTLGEPVDRPGSPPSRRVALIASIFVVVPFVSIPAFPLGGGGDGPVLAAPQVVAAP